ncbi:major capsid protein [Micromonospora maritima]|uniref:major capsid protein n=1 Tax=Micromonospora maritima TaxID=986711 RepID=UPI00157CCB4A|nr:major capsid protein [Micromonospora maritima]
MPTQQIAYPLAAPTLSGNVLTVDTALSQPTRITRRIMDLTLQRFIVDRIFNTNAGSVSGGAVIYDQATTNELYTDRDVERVGPGDEFPVVGSQRPVPKVALVEKWGGKFFVTDEARDRNDVAFFNNQVTQLANTIVKKVNTRAIETLEAAISSFGGALTFTGHNWSTVVTGGSSQTNNSGWPAADFANAQYLADTDELGVTYDLWIVNPKQRMDLAITYGSALNEVLDSLDIEVYPSNRVPNGTAYAVARGQVGELRVEQGLGSETWREQATQRTWVQSSVRPVMYVTNPYSIRKITGLNG